MNSYYRLFFHELITLCELEDSALTRLDCYKNVSNLIPLRVLALRAISTCHYIADVGYREKILVIFLKVLEKNNSELQAAAFECLQKFINGLPVDNQFVCVQFY